MEEKSMGIMEEKSMEKIVKEMAEAEFDRFIECMDLYFDTAEMDADDLTGFNKNKSRLVRAIQNASLVINDNGEAVFTPKNPKSKHQEPIVFHERSGVSLSAMDGKRKNHDVAKTYAVMGEMCKVHPKVFAGLVGNDIKVCESLFILLMD